MTPCTIFRAAFSRSATVVILGFLSGCGWGWWCGFDELPRDEALAVYAECLGCREREVDPGAVGVAAARVGAGLSLRARTGLPIGIVGVPGSDVDDLAIDAHTRPLASDADARTFAREMKRQ